jgi:sec-independent protein translocase protein TatB
MFDFAWSEIVLIGAVALIAIGPKDMPAAIRTVSGMVKKARRMAAEFQTHVDEMVREADLGDVKKAFNDIRNLDLSSAIEKHVDPDRSIRNTFADNPLEPSYPAPTAVSAREMADTTPTPFPETAPESISASQVEAEPHLAAAPAFIPPGMVPPPVPQSAPRPPEAPAFIPPEAVLQRQSKA